LHDIEFRACEITEAATEGAEVRTSCRRVRGAGFARGARNIGITTGRGAVERLAENRHWIHSAEKSTGYQRQILGTFGKPDSGLIA